MQLFRQWAEADRPVRAGPRRPSGSPELPRLQSFQGREPRPPDHRRSRPQRRRAARRAGPLQRPRIWLADGRRDRVAERRAPWLGQGQDFYHGFEVSPERIERNACGIHMLLSAFANFPGDPAARLRLLQKEDGTRRRLREEPGDQLGVSLPRGEAPALSLRR